MLDSAMSCPGTATAGALKPEDLSSALETLTRAFVNDPPCRWLFPDGRQYQRYFPAFAQAFGGAAIVRGTVLSAHNGAGVALWLTPGIGPDEDALKRLIDVSVDIPRKPEVFALFEEMGRVHPTEPHWYLPLIGVDPAHQGRGLGSVLLQHMLDVCDIKRLPAYLEATSTRIVPLYCRHGFKPIGEIRVGDCPPIVPMLRQPAKNRSA